MSDTLQNIARVKNIKISNNLPFILIAGPCQVETLDHSLFMAQNIINITNKLGIDFIYKSSFDKANRSSANGPRGAGLDASLKIFAAIKENFDCPILTDVHEHQQCAALAQYVDVLQIPAFLCRQTNLLQAAAKTGKVVNVKKGQFLAPQDMKNVVTKLQHFGAKDIMLTERGACFGYNNLVSDMRSLVIMAQTGFPVIFDATHSVQTPGGLGSSSGGQREFVQVLANSAASVGVAGIFMEVHQDPDNAPSDGPCMLRLDALEHVLQKLQKYDAITKEGALSSFTR
jgi:2-dehydro-3-deoxyphosphooctonate aldolase (KDO 8-P synthase)